MNLKGWESYAKATKLFATFSRIVIRKRTPSLVVVPAAFFGLRPSLPSFLHPANHRLVFERYQRLFRNLVLARNRGDWNATIHPLLLQVAGLRWGPYWYCDSTLHSDRIGSFTCL